MPRLLDSAKLANIDTNLVPSLERRRLRTYGLILLIDGILFNLDFATAGLIWEGYWAEPHAMLAAAGDACPPFYTIALYNGTYGLRALTDWLFAVRKSTGALVIYASLVNFAAFYTKSNEEFSHLGVTIGLELTAVLMIVICRLIATLIKRRWGGHIANRLVIDDGGSTFLFPDAVSVSAAG